ncbi:hypothetical protein [Novosphingobium sp.]|uniref:hypothetical protein n=1 Tax=Novosphingobium sp. TaxID=1874826 RepID=UPI002624D684|nr:hypothetical protein [Novosphingobium sp.]
MRLANKVMVMLGPVSALAALTGCGRGEPPPPPPRDPVIAAVLQEPLMTDPDLVGLSQEGALFTLAGPASAPIPLIDRTDDERAKVRAGIVRMIGADAQPAPDPAPAMTGTEPAATLADTAARLVRELRRDPRCAVPAGRSAIWGASLPEAVPILPRGHLIDGVGNDLPGCRLRAVTFLTPLSPREVIDFYWNLAGAARLSPRHDAGQDDARIFASGGEAGFAAYVRTRADGTAVTLVTVGL